MASLEQLAIRVMRSGKTAVNALAELKKSGYELKLTSAEILTVCRDAGIFDMHDQLRLKPVVALLSAAPGRANYFKIHDQGGSDYTLLPPHVVGEGNHRPLQNRSRAVYLAGFADACLRGRSSFIDLGDIACGDFEAWERDAVDDDRTRDPGIFEDFGSQALLLARDPEHAHSHLDEGFNLLGLHSAAFGHWMWEFLPKYLQALAHGLSADVPVLIDEGLPPSHRAALSLLAPYARIVEIPSLSTVRVAQLWCAPTIMPMPVFSVLNERFRIDLLNSPNDRSIRMIEACRKAAARISAGSGSERIYLARRSKRRELVNDAVISDILREFGFTILYPEELEFEQQVAVMKSARFVVGPEGSALTLCVFLDPGAQLLLLNHTITVALAPLTCPLEGAGIVVRVVSGPIVQPHPDWPHFSDYWIDPETFRRELTAMLARDASCSMPEIRP